MTAPADSAQSHRPVRWRIVALLMALCFISHLNRISMAVAGDERIMREFSIAPEKMGVIYSAFLLVYTLCMIPGGFFIDRFGARAALTVVGLGSALFGMLTGLTGFVCAGAAQIWLSLVVVRGLMGLFTSPLHPGCARAVTDWAPVSGRSLINGLVTGAALLGVASTYKVFGSLIERLEWTNAFLVTGAVTALLAGTWMLVSREAERTRDSAHDEGRTGVKRPGSHSGWSALLKNRSVLLLTLSYAAIGYFQYLFFYWMHFYFDEVLHLGKSASQYYAGIPPLAMAVGMPVGGWVSDRLRTVLGHRWGRAVVPLAGMVSGAVLLGLGVFAKEPAWIVTWFSLALAVVGACEGSFWSTAVEIGADRGGTTAAIINTGGNAGGLLAPVVTPWVSTLFHWQIGIGLGGLVCLLGAVCWF